MNEKVLKLSDMHSGYSADPAKWEKFLRCWYEASVAAHLGMLKKTPDIPFFPILNKYVVSPSNRGVTEDIALSIRNSEKTLGVTLPKSYKDFLLAYQPPLLRAQKTHWGEVLIGMYAPSQIGRVADLFPLKIEISKKYPIETEDKEYFIYGIEQDDASSLVSNLSDAIVVGKYSDQMHALIVLYPQIRSADGEMEAALYTHSGEFRAPSFAELMRQLSFMETNPGIPGPPFLQTKLKGTCADKLSMINVWWK
ncbi:hypothetical protein ACO0LL_27445 [Undibacterium sp. TC4M20W]|uniref:hypothetical protein n=1 Tax=Undibacterium sp. TC4M20W TaxID=3413052 RepID=UPI003BEFA0AE